MSNAQTKGLYINSKGDRLFLTFLTAAAYFASYMTRINYKAVLAEIMNSEGYSKEQASLALTGLFITYGIGQLISGKLGDIFNPKYLMCGGLVVASATNIILPAFSGNLTVMVIVWCINGIGQAFMWPPIVKTLANFLSPDDFVHACIKVSWGSAFATIALYLLSPVLISVASWKVLFYICAAIGLGGAVLIFLSISKLEKKYPNAGKLQPEENPEGDNKAADNRPPVMPKRIYWFFAILLVGIILQGMLRDGVDSWMPSYIRDTFDLGTSVSILSGVVLPIFTLISYQVATFAYEKILKNEMTCSAAFFTLAAACSGLLLLVRRLFPESSGFSAVTVASILLFAVIVSSMHAINTMFTCLVPRQFRKFGNISWISGLTNFATYVGSAVSTYGFAALTQNFGWDETILSWVVISAAGVAVCFIGLKPWLNFLKKHVNKN